MLQTSLRTVWESFRTSYTKFLKENTNEHKRNEEHGIETRITS